MRGSFDFETWQWINPLCCGFAWGASNTREHFFIHDKTHKDGDDLARRALIYMHARRDIKQWWAHNMGRFDGQFLLKAAVSMGWTADAHVSASRAVKLSFRPPGSKDSVHCFDSMALVPASLRRCATDFELPSRKFFTEDDYKIDTRRWAAKKLKTGCLVDCDLVLELLDKVESLFEPWGGELRATFSSSALTVVRARLEEQGDALPSHRDFQEVNEACRSAYYGGRVEVIHHQPDSLLTEWDVNSSYPWSMTQPLPWDYLGEVKTSRGMRRILEGDREGVIYARVEVPASGICGKLPPLPFRPPGGGVYFPTGAWEGWFPACELRYADSLGVDVQPLEGYAYTVKQPFKSFVKEVYSLKSNATGAMRSFAKYLLNGCYGKFGQSPEREVLSVVADAEEADRIIASAIPGTVGKLCGDDPRFLTRKVKRWAPQTHYALASYITAYSRILLHKAMCKVKGPAYVDTDAVHAKSGKLVIGKDLGRWKVEMTHYRAKFWAPKIYELHPLGPNGGRLKAHYAAKGFTLRDGKGKGSKSAKEQFRTIIEGDALVTPGGRNRLLKTQLRKGGEMARVEEIKRWAGRSRKRFPYPEGSTRPWTVKELQAGAHEEARCPFFPLP